MPGLPTIRRPKHRRILDTGISRIRVVQGRLNVPDAFEFPRMRRAVIPLMGRQRLARFRRSIINELIALALGHSFWRSRRLSRLRSRLLPGFAAIIRALNDLSKPTAGLRNIKSIRIHRRTFRMIDFPPGKMGSADLPLFALAIGCQNERALFCANQQSYLAHLLLLFLCLFYSR